MFRLLLQSVQLSFVLLPVFIVLNILDGHSTYQVLKPNHFEREKNPVARWVFRKLHIPTGIILFKAILLSILIPCILYYVACDPLIINIVLLSSNLLFLLVVIHNYRVFSRIRTMRGIYNENS